LVSNINAKNKSHRKHHLPKVHTHEKTVLVTAKIYSNLAEITRQIDNLPIEFSVEEWSDIRPDSLILVDANITLSHQTITEKKESLNNEMVYVRSPFSSLTETKYLPARLIDDKRNLVEFIQSESSKESLFFIVPPDNIGYTAKPPELKYYVNFSYVSNDTVHLSYLRSNLNWKPRYQLHLFEESEDPTFIIMADIRNDGQSRIDIASAELFAGDINLRTSEPQLPGKYETMKAGARDSAPPASVGKDQELAGLHVFPINETFSIDAKANYLLPMPHVEITVQRVRLIQKNYFIGSGKINR